MYLNPINNRYNSCGFPSAFNSLDKQIEALFAGFPAVFDSEVSGSYSSSSGTVATRWYESDEAYLLRFDLPGVARQDISVALEDGGLSVAAERRFESGSDEEGEARSAYTYRKSVELPESVEEDKIAAKYENGVLSLTVPKGEKAKPRQIEVRS